MRLVFFGTSAFAVPSLERLVERRAQIVCRRTQPDRPQGRGQQLGPSPVKLAAQRLGPRVAEPEGRGAPTPPPGFGTEGLTISPTTASPGDPLTLTVVGRPGQVAIIAFSTQNSGARVGSLGLALGPDFGAVGAGPINALGVFLVTRAVPAGLPPGSYFFQAALTTDANTLRDLTLTNGVSLVVGARGSFSASVAGQPTAGAAPLTVAFTSTLTGGVAPYLYAWTFGDGTTSTVANPRKTYSAPGVYLVTLTVTDAEARTVVSNPVTIIVLRDSPS